MASVGLKRKRVVLSIQQKLEIVEKLVSQNCYFQFRKLNINKYCH
jgi:hypothetical protein